MLNFLSNKESNQHRFRCGNLKTLSVDNIGAELKRFHQQYYSANIMKLVISSKHSME